MPFCWITLPGCWKGIVRWNDGWATGTGTANGGDEGFCWEGDIYK